MWLLELLTSLLSNSSLFNPPPSPSPFYFVFHGDDRGKALLLWVCIDRGPVVGVTRPTITGGSFAETAACMLHTSPLHLHTPLPLLSYPFLLLFCTCKIVGPLSSFLLKHPKHTCLDWNGSEWNPHHDVKHQFLHYFPDFKKKKKFLPFVFCLSEPQLNIWRKNL